MLDNYTVAHEEPVESGRQIRVPLMSEMEQGTRKVILRELALLVCVNLAWIWGGEAGKAGLSKAISAS